MINKSNIWYVISGCLFAFVLGSLVVFFIKKSHGTPDGAEVDWRVLGEMDYITGKASENLIKFSGQDVKVPGFMVPLEDDQKEVHEFLLVPTPQACIHVPAPPPNQMVYVKMKPGKKAEVPYGPIWVHGQLNLVTKKSMYGDASFELEGVLVEDYK